MSDETYEVKIVMRDGMGQTNDDYHATVTRMSDETKLIWISRWRWLLDLQLKPKRIDRAFGRYDKRKEKLSMEEERKL